MAKLRHQMTDNVQMLGNAALMERPKVAFLSSRRVAPAAVMRCYDWATEMRGGGCGATAWRAADRDGLGARDVAERTDGVSRGDQRGADAGCVAVFARRRQGVEGYGGEAQQLDSRPLRRGGLRIARSKRFARASRCRPPASPLPSPLKEVNGVTCQR